MAGNNEEVHDKLKSALLSMYKDTTIMEMKRFNDSSSFRPTYKEVLYMYGIASKENCTATDLVKMFNISKETISIALSKMEKKGYIERTVDPDDNRRQFITISDKTYLELESQQVTYGEAMNRLHSKYTNEDIETAANIILDLTRELQKIADSKN